MSLPFDPYTIAPDGHLEAEEVQRTFEGFSQRLAALESRVFDSGWLADNNTVAGLRTYTHNLALVRPPKQVSLWFSPDQATFYPVNMSGMQTTTIVAAAGDYYRNPGLVRVNLNTLEIGVYAPAVTYPIYSGYTGAAWINYGSGYWRYRIVK